MSEQPIFRFGSFERGLLGCALNEVINGFDVPNFEHTIGAETNSLEQLLTRFHALNNADELALGVVETRFVRNALRETIRELGVEEFHIRTGYELEHGEALLQKLNRLLGEN